MTNDCLGYDLTFGLPPIRVGWWLRDVRTRLGHREADVAERVGVPGRTLRRWESGSLVPSDLELSRLAAVYGCGVTDLVPGRERVTLDRAVGDRSTGVLRIGTRQTAVDLESNDAILRRYLSLVRAIRNLTPDAPVHLRHDDVAALADELDLDDSELEARLVSLAGITADEARWVRRQLLRRRVVTPLLGLGTATASILGVGALIARAGHGTDSATSTTVASTLAPAASEAFTLEVPLAAPVPAESGDQFFVVAQTEVPSSMESIAPVPGVEAVGEAPARPAPARSARIRSSAIAIDNTQDTVTGGDAVIGDAVIVDAGVVAPEGAPAPAIVVEFGESDGAIIEAS